MPFYKCYGCMKTFRSESRVTSCKYCHKILSESVNRTSGPPRLKRSLSAPLLPSLTQDQQVRVKQLTQHKRRFMPECPSCSSKQVTCMGSDESGKSQGGKLYGCACDTLFIWDPDIQFDGRFTYMDVGDFVKPLNILGFRCLGLDTGMIAVHNIFKIGFPAKGEANLAYRTKVQDPIIEGFEGLQSFPKVGDIMPESGHCFSKTLPGCTTFPNDTSKTYTYLFVCFLRSGFDTHGQQLIDSETILSYYPGLIGERDEIEWPLHAFEVACDSVDPLDLWACIPCTKVWASKHWKHGGTFMLRLDGLVFRTGLSVELQQHIRKLCVKHAKGTIPPTLL